MTPERIVGLVVLVLIVIVLILTAVYLVDKIDIDAAKVAVNGT